MTIYDKDSWTRVWMARFTESLMLGPKCNEISIELILDHQEISIARVNVSYWNGYRDNYLFGGHEHKSYDV